MYTGDKYTISIHAGGSTSASHWRGHLVQEFLNFDINVYKYLEKVRCLPQWYFFFAFSNAALINHCAGHQIRTNCYFSQIEMNFDYSIISGDFKGIEVQIYNCVRFKCDSTIVGGFNKEKNWCHNWRQLLNRDSSSHHQGVLCVEDPSL